MVEEVGRRDSAMRTVISVQTSLVCSSILRWGTEEQKQRYLPKLCSGEWLGCFGLTEPDTGSDAANQKTRARKTDDGWVINGNKMWISLGNHAELAMIFAQTDPEKEHRGLACFLVRDRHAGLQHQEIHGKMGLHGIGHRLDRARRRRGARRRAAGRGRRGLQGRHERARLRAATRSPPAASASARARSTTRSPYSKEREQFGRPIASFQLVQAMIADMRVQTDAARLLVFRAGWLKDQGKPSTTETSIAKLYATEAAQNCAHLAIQVHGGSGYVDDHPVERYFRDVARHHALRGHLADPEADHRPRRDRDQRAGLTVRPIGVAGAGTMGAGIAALAAEASLRTLLYDPDPRGAGAGARGRRAGPRPGGARRRAAW